MIEGNGSGGFEIHQEDKGGWLRVYPARMDNIPDDLPVFLSETLIDWFRERPQAAIRSVTPINKDGNTVELHAFYELRAIPQLNEEDE